MFSKNISPFGDISDLGNSEGSITAGVNIDWDEDTSPSSVGVAIALMTPSFSSYIQLPQEGW